MAFHFEELKKFINEYFSDLSGLEKYISKKNAESNLFNKELFELEILVQQIKEKQKIDLNLNPRIHSERILKSFGNVSLDSYFKQVDYQLNFFYHLATNYVSTVDLHEYIRLLLSLKSS